MTTWGRIEGERRGDVLGVRTLPDGRLEYLMHNEGLCRPYYVAVNAPASDPSLSVQPEEEEDERTLDPAVKLLADVMHLWVDGYIGKNPNSMAERSISDDKFESIDRLLTARGISVDFCGWRIEDPEIRSQPECESSMVEDREAFASAEVKLNQYGLTCEEWSLMVEFGNKLHDTLMEEPEGEDWYDGQSLKIMESMVQVFKAGKAMVKNG